jgi:hypothetical protein
MLYFLAEERGGQGFVLGGEAFLLKWCEKRRWRGVRGCCRCGGSGCCYYSVQPHLCQWVQVERSY